MQSCDKFATVSCLCVIAHAHMCRDGHQVLQANVMNPDSDSVNVIRLWSESAQPSGDANIIICLWCFTLLMNLHDLRFNLCTSSATRTLFPSV